MPRIEAIYISPVKSLALQRLVSARLTAAGIAEDRRFFLVNPRDRLVTQREYGALTQVKSTYDLASNRLTLEFPDGRVVEGEPCDGEPLTARFFGKYDREAFEAQGPWSRALSEFSGGEMRLVRAANVAFDALPVSMCSVASVDALRASSGESAIDERRFRPNFYISGVDAHGEDDWIGHDIRIGRDAVVRILMRDERCEMTTHDPDTGEYDVNTLRLIANYRTDQPKQVNFGVYGTVVSEGDVSVGDEIVPV